MPTKSLFKDTANLLIALFLYFSERGCPRVDFAQV